MNPGFIDAIAYLLPISLGLGLLGWATVLWSCRNGSPADPDWAAGVLDEDVRRP